MSAGDRGPADPAASEAARRPAMPHALELALRHGLRYSGLRETKPDPRMLLYVPLATCERELVLPLAVDETVLEVATAQHDPDLSVVAERFPDLDVELVLTPVERIAELHDELRAGS